ncbi:MAG: GreA/GreB family elongation factor [Bacteroidales bacterium]|jgi:transcription elongation factor GreB|nr:GreA/GreB family elongation factor [Bacteroidales bacterium]MDD4214121.1 GreA/GreB family elongation factor [Bacteroidales bacterium]
MSRGFVKEDDQEDIPLVPPRAYLPEGVTNYVTQVGMKELLAEKQKMIYEKDNLNISNENEKRIAKNYINAKLILLNNRINSAKIVYLNDQQKNEIRFGATVTLKTEATNKVQTFQIVGVDEANISKGKLSFISPLAKVLLNKKTGDFAILKLAREERVFKIINICYETGNLISKKNKKIRKP